MGKEWITIMNTSGIVTRIKVSTIYGIQSRPKEILIFSSWKERFHFAIQEDLDDFGRQIITKEELKKLKRKLLEITE